MKFNKKRFLILTVLTILFLIGAGGCMFDETESVQEMYSEFMSSKEKLAETVVEYLQDKYGEKFEVKKTSSSIDSDSLELSVTSEKYPEVIKLSCQTPHLPRQKANTA